MSLNNKFVARRASTLKGIQTTVEPLEARTHLSATYYLSPAGSDSNAGTSITAPWKSIAKLNKAKISAGSSILFQGGATFAGSISGKGGTSTSPVTYSSYGTGRAVINAGAGTGFSATGKAGLIIQNLNFAGNGYSTNTGNGILLSGSYLTVDQVDIGGFGTNGIDFTKGSHNVNVTYTTIHDGGYAGIQVQGTWDTSGTGTTYTNSNVYIGHDTIWNIFGRSTDSQHTGNGMELWDVDNATVERCVVHDNGINNPYTSGPAGIWCWQANHVTFQYNESYHNLTGKGDADGFDFDGGTINSVMQYNYAHDNQGAGILSWEFSGARPMHDNTIRYNICQNNGTKNNFFAEITTGGGTISNMQVYNNTLYSSTANGAWMASVTSGHFCNNLIQTTSTHNPWVSAGSMTLAGNDFWNGASVSLPGGISVDPKLIAPGGGGTIGNADLLYTLSAYQLTSTSPLMDAGIDLQSQYGINAGTQDFYGTLIPQHNGYDIGAAEYV